MLLQNYLLEVEPLFWLAHHFPTYFLRCLLEICQFPLSLVQLFIDLSFYLSWNIFIRIIMIRVSDSILKLQFFSRTPQHYYSTLLHLCLRNFFFHQIFGVFNFFLWYLCASEFLLFLLFALRHHSFNVVKHTLNEILKLFGETAYLTRIKGLDQFKDLGVWIFTWFSFLFSILIEAST